MPSAGLWGPPFCLEPVSTLDADVLVSFKRDPGSLLISPQPLFDYLRRRGCEVKGKYIVIGEWPVQFLPPTGPLAEEALVQAVSREVSGEPVRVFTAEHLAAIAVQAGLAKDKARLLRFVESGVLDASKFEELVIRHGLTDAWQRFGRQFLGDAPGPSTFKRFSRASGSSAETSRRFRSRRSCVCWTSCANGNWPSVPFRKRIILRFTQINTDSGA